MRRLGDASYLTAVPGQMYHGGDVVRSGAQPLVMLYCPQRVRLTLMPRSEMRFAEARVELVRGRIGDQSLVPECLLPSVARRSRASEQHHGESVLFSDERIATLEEAIDNLGQRGQAVRNVLAPFDEKLRGDPNDSEARLGRITILERLDLGVHAVEDLELLSGTWPDAAWVRSKLFVHREKAKRPKEPGPGDTRALLIGISEYAKRIQKDDTVPSLLFAHRDAELARDFLASPRGGSVKDIQLLSDREATLPRIQAAFDHLLKSLRPEDTAIILFSGHGTSDATRGYLMTHDSFPGLLSSTALPMDYIAQLIKDVLGRARRVLVFVDACRAGALTLSETPNQAYSLLQLLLQPNRKLLVFAACQASQISVEGNDYGGGHGAFTYFLIRALNGDADTNLDRRVTAQEVVSNVIQNVLAKTPNGQLPAPFGGLDYTFTVAETWLPGLPDTWQQPAVIAARSGERGESGAGEPVAELIRQAQKLLSRQGQLSRAEFLPEALRLSVTLENYGQSVLVRYLLGEEESPRPDEFASCAESFRTASRLVPESLWLRARYHFCRGRERVFAKDYTAAAGELEQSIRLDPAGAYSFNALGIAYLEMARYDRALAAFQDAVGRAPRWAYAWNNLALAHTQRGNYREALRAYDEGRRLARTTPYLAYNRALLYQLLNRRREAEAAYRELIEQHPDHALAHNALGSLLANTRRRRQAEAEFREALRLDSSLLSARHNLALLLSRDKRRREEAIALWRENLKLAPNHRPSLSALEQALKRRRPK